jgi:hypothetical protein
MAFRAFEEITGPIMLPIRGKNYTLPAVSLTDGVAMHRAAAGGEAFPLEDLLRAILGDVREEMVKDGVPAGVIDRALWTGVADFQSGREAAELVWEHGVPKEILANLLAPLQEALTPPAEASTTKPPASGNGTTKATKPKATPSRGPKSLTTVSGPSSSPTSPTSTGSAFTKNSPIGASSNT